MQGESPRPKWADPSVVAAQVGALEGLLGKIARYRYDLPAGVPRVEFEAMAARQLPRSLNTEFLAGGFTLDAPGSLTHPVTLDEYETAWDLHEAYLALREAPPAEPFACLACRIYGRGPGGLFCSVCARMHAGATREQLEVLRAAAMHNEARAARRRARRMEEFLASPLPASFEADISGDGWDLAVVFDFVGMEIDPEAECDV